MFKTYKRITNLWRAATPGELLVIAISMLISRKFESVNLHRLLIFTLACSDKEMTLKKDTPQTLIINWKENGKDLKMTVRKQSRDLLVFSEFFLEEGYLFHAKKIERKEDVKFILDAGANIGCAALFLYVWFPNAKIVCLEPETENFQLLTRNVQINGLSGKIDVVNKAIWNTVTRLNLMQRDWSTDAFHVMDKEISDEVISTTETITISRVMDDVGAERIDFLKMDIEGAEKVLFEDRQHSKDFLSHVRHLVIEVHEEFVATEFICSSLEELGFKYETAPQSGDSVFVIATKIG